MTRNERRLRRRECVLDALIVVASVGCIACSGSLFFETKGTAEAVDDAQRVLAASQAAQEEMVIVSDMTLNPPENPNEAEMIEAALLSQGYFRDDVPLTYELQDVLQTACKEHDVEYSLALAVIETESAFILDADNGTCYGLMQLNRDYFPDELSPAENIRHGIEFLGSLLKKYEETTAALTAYNAGHDTGDRAYANKVMKNQEKWEEILDG